MSTAQKTAKHTPGPWLWKKGYDTLSYPWQKGPCASGLYGPNDNPVVIGIWRNDDEADCEATSEANGMLIAAAPELLEALIRITHGETVPECPGSHPDELVRLAQQIFGSAQKIARDAIAKAVGAE